MIGARYLRMFVIGERLRRLAVLATVVLALGMLSGCSEAEQIANEVLRELGTSGTTKAQQEPSGTGSGPPSATGAPATRYPDPDTPVVVSTSRVGFEQVNRHGGRVISWDGHRSTVLVRIRATPGERAQGKFDQQVEVHLNKLVQALYAED